MEEKGEKLCEAARIGDVAGVTSLIDAGYDVTYFDADGFTPLMYAAKLGHHEVISKLLEAGAPWNALSPSSLSAGDFAMQNGHQDAFDLLLNTGSSLYFSCIFFADLFLIYLFFCVICLKFITFLFCIDLLDVVFLFSLPHMLYNLIDCYSCK